LGYITVTVSERGQDRGNETRRSMSLPSDMPDHKHAISGTEWVRLLPWYLIYPLGVIIVVPFLVLVSFLIN
jgi:hypothetical protein